MQTQKYDLHKIGSIIFRAAVGLTIAIESLGLGALFYLSTFTRYIADDFCEIALLRGGPVWSVIFEKYMGGSNRSANRFTKFLFVDLTELLGKHDIQLLPILMILLWLLGLFWIFREVKKRIDVQYPVIVDFFMAVSIVLFSILQAPNLFQIYFWRSSSLTHFAPVVLYLLLSVFILRQIRSAKGNTPPLWVSLTVFLAAFVSGGSGETTTVFMVAIYFVLLLYFWRYQGPDRHPGLLLFTLAFAGAFLALCGLFFAPANFLHGKTSLLTLPIAVLKSLKFAFEFIWDTVLTLPLPTLISVILPGLVFFGLYVRSDQHLLAPVHKKHIRNILFLLPLLGYLLIAVSFTPSAYAQAYPIERARFLGRFLMTAALMFEGALLGVWFAQLKAFLFYRQFLFPLAGLFLLIVGLYPLRGGFRLWNSAESYKAWAVAWDERDQDIRSMADSGEQDLVVAWFPNRFGIKDIDGSTKHWVNRCVADYYGVNTIRSVPVGE